MTFTDIITHPSKLFHSFSMNDNLNNKDQHQKFKRLNTSILNLFPRQQQTNNLERKHINEQAQQNLFLHPPSIITTSELSRSISNRSITFASIFDESENDNNNKDNDVTFDLGTSIENEDLVIIVPNKYVENEPVVNNGTTEPYPFRSEIPSCSLPKSNSSTNIVSSSHLGKKSLHHLIHYYRPKKLRHPVQTIQSVNKIDRSNSAPNMLFLLSSTPTSTTTDIIKTSDHSHRQSLKTIRRWFKSSSFGRFFQSFTKHPNRTTNTSNTKHLKQKSRLKSTTSRKYSDLIY